MSEEPKPGSNMPSGASQTVDPQSVEGIFLEALAKERGPKRSEFLDAACAGSSELRTRVEALLRAYDDAGSFLQQPAGDWRNPPVTAAAGSSAEIDARGIPAGLLKASDDPNALGMIGPYQVRELIGRGGMGIVFRAFDAKLNRVVAIKVLAPELAAQSTARRRFLREAQAAAAVAHPHVVTIHAVDEHEWPYLVMECIEGQSLEEKIERSGTLKLAEVLRIGTQMAEGLAAAHKQGLVHRDVKPANILLENGVERVKITDFGLARAADDVTITRPGEISGTPQYMSPEQASGQRVDQRTDLFSLGCVLYAMCAGQPPFRADSIAAIVKKICTDSPQPLREIDQQVPDWLAAVIDRLLAKDPNERIQSADEVAKLLGDALARLQAGQPITAEGARASGTASSPLSSRGASAAAGNYLIFNPGLPRFAQWICAYGLVISPVLFALQLASILAFTVDENKYIVGSEVIALPIDFLIVAVLFVGGLKLRELRRLGVTWLKAGLALQTLWLPVYIVALGAWQVVDPQVAAAFDQPGNGRDFISLSLIFICYGFGIFALVWLMRNSQNLPLVSDQPQGRATDARLPPPAWLVVVSTALAGYFFGRLVPMPGGRNEGWWFMSAMLVAAVLLYSQVRRLASSGLSAILIGVGMIAFLVTSRIGHDRFMRYRFDPDHPDWIVLAACALVLYIAWQNRRHANAIALARSSVKPDSAPAALETQHYQPSMTSRPWHVAGWLVVVLLSFMVLVPVLAVIAYLVPAYQARQSRHDAQQWQATMARLKMTFDEDLPITDILIDGTSSGPVEISPVERGCASGERTVTVVYTHGDRKRSVRETVKLAPNEDRTLDLTPLVLADIKRRDDKKRAATPDVPQPARRVLQTFRPTDQPISGDAKWIGDELEVTATEAGTVRLFELPLARIDDTTLAFNFVMQADDLASGAYAEMLCRSPGMGEFFSNGHDQKVRGTEKRFVELPFYLLKDQFADLLKLNLIFEGPGKVRLSGIEAVAKPLSADVLSMLQGSADPAGLPIAGPPKVAKAFSSNDKPISAAAKWVGDELEVTATEAGPVRLFEMPLDRIDQSVITYRYSIKADSLASNVYPEMWTRVAGSDEFFSRGLDDKVHGTFNWTSVEISAVVEKDEFADLVKLNVVFEGPGTIRLTGIEVLAMPVPAEEMPADEMSAEEGPPTEPSSANSETGTASIEWGRPARQVQLGWNIKPKKETYRPGELITVALFLRNVGEEPITSTMPRTQILETLGLAIDLRNAENLELPWKWGRAHKDGQEISGGFGETFAPKVPYALPPFIVAIGQSPAQVTAGISETIMVELVPDVAAAATADKLPHQPLRLKFKLSSFGYELGNEADLECEAFQFRIAALP